MFATAVTWQRNESAMLEARELEDEINEALRGIANRHNLSWRSSDYGGPVAVTEFTNGTKTGYRITIAPSFYTLQQRINSAVTKFIEH